MGVSTSKDARSTRWFMAEVGICGGYKSWEEGGVGSVTVRLPGLVVFIRD